MRLPWPFRGAQRAPAGSDASPPDAVPGGTGAGLPERGAGDAWRQLPPLAETIGPPPLVAPARPFAAALAASNPPPPALQPLAHGHSLEAPRGIVVGVARPTTAPAGPPLPRAVQRSPIAGARRQVDASADGAESEALPEAAPAPGPAESVGVSEAAPAVTARRVGVASATVQPGARRLTLAPTPAGAGAKPGLIGQPAAAMGPRPRATEPVTPIQRAPAPPAPPPAATDAPRLTLGQARRRGLGAPVAGGPVSGTAMPFAGSPDLPASGPSPLQSPSPSASAGPTAPPSLQPAMEMPQSALPMPASGDVAPPPAASGPSTPAAMPMPRPAATVLARRVGPAGDRRADRAADRAASRGASPITSARPLLGRVQRAPLTLPQRASTSPEPGAGAPAPSTVGTAAGPVRIHRDGQANQLSTALDARSFTHGGEIFLPASHGPLTAGTGKALLAHELTHVAQQRRLGTSLPAEHTPHGQSLEAEAVVAERSPDLPLAVPAASASAATTTSGAAGPISAATGAHARPQRAPADGAVGPRGQDAKAGATGGSAPTSAHAHTEQELEVLAHQLYHRIGRHLRRELLVDRERLGLALDLP